jgi:hypothetical protein
MFCDSPIDAPAIAAAIFRESVPKSVVARIPQRSGTSTAGDAVDLAGVDVRQQPLQGRSVGIRAGKSAIVVAVWQALPAGVLLAGDVGLTGLPLRIQADDALRRVEQFLADDRLERPVPPDPHVGRVADPPLLDFSADFLDAHLARYGSFRTDMCLIARMARYFARKGFHLMADLCVVMF